VEQPILFIAILLGTSWLPSLVNRFILLIVKTCVSRGEGEGEGWVIGRIRGRLTSSLSCGWPQIWLTVDTIQTEVDSFSLKETYSVSVEIPGMHLVDDVILPLSIKQALPSFELPSLSSTEPPLFVGESSVKSFIMCWWRKRQGSRVQAEVRIAWNSKSTNVDQSPLRDRSSDLLGEIRPSSFVDLVTQSRGGRGEDGGSCELRQRLR
jgi:hypothetical protein